MKLKSTKNQQGAVLALCLVFLVALTVLAVGSMETTILEERMAGNMQDYNRAFMAAETSLQVAETWIAGQSDFPTATANGSSNVWTTTGLDPSSTNLLQWWDERSNTWWNINADTAMDLGDVATDPQYVIEEYLVSDQGQALNTGTGETMAQRVYHRITVRGVGGNDNTQVMLQTTYARLFQ